MAQPRGHGRTRAKAPTSPPAPKGDDAMQQFCHMLDFGGWDRRDPVNKAMLVVREAADQIGGLSTVAYGLAFAEIAKRGNNPPLGRSEWLFVAKLTANIATHLERAHAAYWDVMRAEDGVSRKGTAVATKGGA